jgi:cysteine-rich repeat protein
MSRLAQRRAPAIAARQLRHAVALVLFVGAGCTFTPDDAPGDGRVACATTEQCSPGQLCVVDDDGRGRCLAAGTPCIEDGAPARFLDDGAPCGANDQICIAHSCTTARCGDGFVTRALGEECDDGDDRNDDDEPGACRKDCRPARCGDLVIDPDEQCDDGAANSDVEPDACRATGCQPARCGDGVIDSVEACDDGPANSDLEPGACRSDCRSARCGDRVRDPGESCDEGDDGNSDVEPDACRAATCQRAACGDGVKDSDEACDDGNLLSGDGCSGDCGKVEQCGDGIVDEGEACDDANDNPRDGCAECKPQQWSHDVVVGGGVDERAATALAVEVEAVAVDPLGRIYVAGGNVVRRVEPDGTLTTIAGDGSFDASAADGQPATSVGLARPSDIAVDLLGRVLLVEPSAHRVRRVERDGTLSTLAGTGAPGFSGDGGPASEAALSSPFAVAVDPFGGVLIADSGNKRIRRVDPDGTIFTVVGNGEDGTPVDGDFGFAAAIGAPGPIAVDADGRIAFLVSSLSSVTVLIVGLDGTLSSIVVPGLFAVRVVAFDSGGALIGVVPERGQVVQIATDGSQTVIAGSSVVDNFGQSGFSGDGGPAVAAQLNDPSDLAVDDFARILVADSDNRRVRRIAVDGTITTVAGNGTEADGDAGNLATTATLNEPMGIAFDREGRIYFSDPNDCRVRRIEQDGTMRTIAGSTDGRFSSGAYGFSGDGGPAVNARLAAPSGIAIDEDGRVFIADRDNARVRRVDVDGTITTIAGNGAPAPVSAGVPATEASLFEPTGVALDTEGRVLIAERGRSRVLRIEADGTIAIIAGTGVEGSAGDGGPATEAQLDHPQAVALDALGRVLIADQFNGVRRIETDGTISTLVEGIADSIAVAPDGDVVFCGGGRVHSIAGDGSVSAIAGTGQLALFANGDGGPATSAALDASGVGVDALGRVLVADGRPGRLRRIEGDGSLTTLAGPVHPRGLARTRLYPPHALTLLPDGNLITVGASDRALRVQLPTGVIDVVVGYDDSADPQARDRARFAAPLEDARGVAFDPATTSLLITERITGSVRVVGLDPDDDGVLDPAERWSITDIPTLLDGPAGIARDPLSGTFVVAEVGGHCVRRIDRDGTILEVIVGRCGTAGVFPGLLNAPTHVAVSSVTGAVYVADTGNHRVLRVDGGGTRLVIGDGSVSSAGEGAPARLFPVQSPAQLALDSFGNLFVASTTTVRLVANVDGDADADGDDDVRTVFGGGTRVNWPESAALCLGALGVDGDDGVFVTDACQGFLVRLVP